MRITVTEAAKVLGTSRQAVYRRINRGTLETDADGTLDDKTIRIEATLRDPDRTVRAREAAALRAPRRPKKAAPAKVAAKQPAKAGRVARSSTTTPRSKASGPAASAPDEPNAPPTNAVPTPLERIKAIEAERAEHRWALEKGRLIDREEAKHLVADFGHYIRSAIQAIPRKMQADLVKHLSCKRCGGAIEGKHIAIAAERCVNDFLTQTADEFFAVGNKLGAKADEKPRRGRPPR